MRAADARTVRLHEETLTYNGGYMYEPWPGHLKLPITSLFVDRNIKCGYSFSKLERAEHFDTKFSESGEIFCFATKPHHLDYSNSIYNADLSNAASKEANTI